ncbi:MAG TPA: hypothetical protein VHV30_02790 [Polyangiaceae bacterium]|jgi:hypothetical protein|nr:hypothetical protein [Polyangiaceae bacterium]
MFRRLILGLVLGLIIGGAVAFGLVRLDDGALVNASDALGYLFAAVAGGITGAVAGKPIWAGNAKIEGGLKAFFGALLAAGGMFGLVRWGFTPPALNAVGADGHTAIANLPFLSLPLIAGVLGAVFGLDNTAEPSKEEAPARKRVAAPARPAGKARLAAADEGESDRDEDAPARRAKP